MPRDGAGLYTLPAGNPVVTLTPIATAWANGTFNDVASALTDSLSRSGLGGMTSAFKVVDGTIGAPGFGYINEPGNGFWRDVSAPSYLKQVSLGAVNFIFGPELSTPRVLRFIGGSEKGIVWQNVGFRRVAEFTDGAIQYKVPSATIDADDWDFAKFVSFDSVSGITTFGVIPYAGTPSRPVLTSFGGWTITDQSVTMNFAGSMQFKFDLPAAPAGNSGYHVWQRAGVVRWAVGVQDDEGGGNSGSNLLFTAYDNAGVQLGVFAKVTRSTGVWNFITNPSVAGSPIIPSSGGTFTGTVTFNGAPSWIATGNARAEAIFYVKNLIPFNGTDALPGGSLDWAATSYVLNAAPGAAITGMTNASQGQMKKILVTGSGALGAISATPGTFAWAKGHPVWGVYRTVVTLQALTTGIIIGFTSPIDATPA